MDRKELVYTLGLASRALSKTDYVPIYQNFAFSGTTVLAYDGQLGIMAPCSTEGAYAINGKTLLGLLGATHAPEITIDVQDNDVVIKAARSTFKLPFLPFEDFYFQEPPDDEWELVLPLTADFKQGLEICIETTSYDTTQEAFMGVYITPGVRGVLYSANGDAISEYKLDAKLKGSRAFMLPNNFCTSLLSLLENEDGDEAIKGSLKISEAWAMAEIGGKCFVYGNMLKNDNPTDWAGQIKKTMKGNPTFFNAPDGLKEALARARVVADAESAKTTMLIEKNRLRLITEATMGIVRDTLAFAGHPDIEVRASAHLIQKGLGSCSMISINDNYCAFKSDKLLVLTGNME